MTEFREIKTAPGQHICGFDCYDWSKGSIALLASDGVHALIVAYAGGSLDYWINEVGYTDEFSGTDAGLWIWKGSILGSRDYWGEYDEELIGEFRKPTTEEWELLQDGDTLWDENEYMKCTHEESMECLKSPE